MPHVHVLSSLALACTISAVAAGSGPGSNPFAGQDFYVNPDFEREISSSISSCTDPVACANLKLMKGVSSAWWIDVKAKINGDANHTTSVASILADAASKTPPQLTVFIVYDLPNRDCHAKASNGEICCTYNGDGTCNYDAGGDCSAGIAQYQASYIDPLAALFSSYEGKVPIVAIIEPDSLPNLATNMGDPHCGNGATTSAYKTGVPYAINAIAAKAPSVSMYLDAAHGGWCGWENNAQALASLVSGLNVASKLRGFSTNVANYQPLGVACPTFDWCLPNNHPNDACCEDPCHVEGQYDPAVQEHQVSVCGGGHTHTLLPSNCIPHWHLHSTLPPLPPAPPFPSTCKSCRTTFLPFSQARTLSLTRGAMALTECAQTAQTGAI